MSIANISKFYKNPHVSSGVQEATTKQEFLWPRSLGALGGRGVTVRIQLTGDLWTDIDIPIPIAILYLLTGAEEACWAHNPKVLGSKPRWARFGDIAFVPERSKGLDSSSSVFVLVGSSPTECIIFSDSEVVITVDFESTIRSSNLRRRNIQLLHFNAGGLIHPTMDTTMKMRIRIIPLDFSPFFLHFPTWLLCTALLLMLTPFFG